jgi:predicted metal-dependent phosphoesterase TrpH
VDRAGTFEEVVVLRSVTHLHTKYSWDGNIEPAAMVDMLVAAGMDLALVSDHDSFRGSRECRQIVEDRHLGLRIPVAAEIRTERGDVVVVFDELADDPPIEELKQWDLLVPIVRDLGGLIWLPHPYQSHHYVEEMAEFVDVIEVFNARLEDEKNRNAFHLCKRHGAVPAFGADVHRSSDLGTCVVEYEERSTLTETLRHEPKPITTDQIPRSSMYAAHATAARRGRQWSTAAYYSLRSLHAASAERKARKKRNRS